MESYQDLLGYQFYGPQNNLPYIYWVECAGCIATNKDFYIDRKENHGQCIIHFIINGSIIQNINNKLSTVNKGDIYVTHPDFKQNYRENIDEENLILLWFEISGSNIKDIFRDIFEKTNGIISNINNHEIYYLLINLLSHIKTAKELNSNDEFFISSSIYNMLMTVLSSVQVDLTDNNIPSEINNALSYITENIQEDISVSTISHHFNYTSAYFTRLFTKHIGINPSKYIMNKKIEKSCSLLLLKGSNIKDISYSLGFFDVSHFSKSFKKITGFTPKDYKKLFNL